MAADAPPFGWTPAPPAAGHGFAAQGLHKIPAAQEPVAGLGRQRPAQGGPRGARQILRRLPGLPRCGRRAGQQFPRQHRQRILVAGRIRFAALLHFGRQIRTGVARAQRLPLDNGHVMVRSQAEIRHPHHAVRSQIDVRGLDIAVHHLGIMGKIQRRRHLPQFGQHFLHRPLVVHPHPAPGPDVHPRGEIADEVNLVAHVYHLAGNRQIGMALVRNPPNAHVDQRHRLLRPPHVRRQLPQNNVHAGLPVGAAPDLAQLGGPHHRRNFIAVPQNVPHPQRPGQGRPIRSLPVPRGMDSGGGGSHGNKKIILPRISAQDNRIDKR